MTESFGELELETPAVRSFGQRHSHKIGALLLWLLVVGGYYWYARHNDLTWEDSITRIAGLVADSLYGPLLYMALYALRPLLFFPATILTLLGGFLFGPIGIVYTIIGSNASAMVAYGVGRYFGRGVLEKEDINFADLESSRGELPTFPYLFRTLPRGGKLATLKTANIVEENAGVIQRYTRRMRENSFETVLLMRLIFLPYDLINYAAGFLKIHWQAFLAATAIGSVPGTVSIVLLGASFGTLEELLNGDITLNPITLIASVMIIGLSFALSRLLRKREAAQLQEL